MLKSVVWVNGVKRLVALRRAATLWRGDLGKDRVWGDVATGTIALDAAGGILVKWEGGRPLRPKSLRVLPNCSLR
ncbi:MAG: hypothetical protein IJO06_11705 [Thermoguttaceae bacterium]|nr:hypothetical protein [Thermoguttaceae bacterium]